MKAAAEGPRGLSESRSGTIGESLGDWEPGRLLIEAAPSDEMSEGSEPSTAPREVQPSMSDTRTVEDSVETQTTERDVEAEYTLEHRVKCPHCATDLASIKVVRLLRAHVNFTSTLPRRGRVLVCSSCQRALSAELAGFA